MTRKPIAVTALGSVLGALLVVSPVKVTPDGSLTFNTALAGSHGNGGGHGNGGAAGRGAAGSHGGARNSSAARSRGNPNRSTGHGKSMGRLPNDHDLDDMH
jgi:hypothetical protein